MDARAAVSRRPIPSSPPGKLLVGWLAAGPVALWASMYGKASAPQLASLLEHSPRAYIRLETFVEELLLLLLTIKRWRSRASTYQGL
jgi:hypothetical protein